MTGQELKSLRKKLKLSLSQASRQCEVSVSTWCRWESGKQDIPLGAVKLFKLLNNVALVYRHPIKFERITRRKAND